MGVQEDFRTCKRRIYAIQSGENKENPEVTSGWSPRENWIILEAFNINVESFKVEKTAFSKMGEEEVSSVV